MTSEELFTRWGAAWVTRDPGERERLLAACCSADVEFIPPDERPVVRGRRALAEHITAYTASWPDGVTVELVRPPETHHGWSRGYVRWTFPATRLVGCDLIRIENGKIATMLVFAENGAADGAGTDAGNGAENGVENGPDNREQT
ncbi:nuclear transport factor 2 family protein [Frankia sp. CNm7]|uniref:Nuclear transport factor 2 family protein n=1 Tax=Frankia nepalensis TaxID=1836974 RepID=A0A937UM32_9ACTN|nr:nuclear transport factor 2 family protein [Frankia nepalensis]MBL7496788.1 nuclear transport factor 2 family protein [Frankia nepalensis]MBL7511559.1 nuclear transport factor 2 family protein [Frankia nepalensis]MBL7518921.1 nuclear transport factor 2 family protein [Frankia nepalensis]MBL7626653.1 nuclear transport factor 2 family protein [Frankia nepalensis]